MTTTEDREDLLRRLADRAEIADVLTTYMDRLDRGLFDEMAELVFTEDAVEDHGVGRPVVQGRAAIAHERQVRHDRTAGAMHVISNILVDFTGDNEANVQSYIRTYCWLPSDTTGPRPVDYVLIGIFLDRFARTAEGWRIRHRRRRNLGPSALAFGELPDFMAGTGGPREAPTPA